MKKRQTPRQGLIWAYCRVSTLKSEQELSLDDQVRWAEEFARQRGAELRLFKERASAKTVIGRPQCARLLAMLENAEEAIPGFLIATSFDRLSRDMTDTLLIARSLKQSGVTLYIRDRGEVAMESFADQAAIVGQAMGGQAENEAKSNRCRASWERRRREGKPTSNKSPYGLQLRGERDIEEPTTAPWVRQVFEWYSSGVGMHTIAMRLKGSAPPHRVTTSRLDAEGKPIFRERNPVWESMRVGKMLTQVRYRDTIVGADLFDRVQQTIGNKPHWRQTREYEYPLSGAIKCLHCGRSFHGHATGGTRKKRLADGTVATYPSRRVRYYGCVVCNYLINADVLEGWFSKAIDAIEADPNVFTRWAGTIRGVGNTDALETERKRLEARLSDGSFDILRQRAWKLALEDDSVAADLPRQLKTISAEEAQCRDHLEEIANTIQETNQRVRTESHARRMLGDFRRLYNAAPYEQRRELANALVIALGGARASKVGLIWLRGKAEITAVRQAES